MQNSELSDAPLRNSSAESLILQAAIFISDEQARKEYLDAACRGDPALRQQVASLLSAAEASGGFMPRPAMHSSFADPALQTDASLDSSRRESTGRFQAPRPPSLGETQLKLGGYELLGIVGSGSFGAVYKARDPELDRIVAIKIPRAGKLTSDADLQRFLREARSVAQLRHPSIVSVHNIDHAEQTPFLVSEFVAGRSLADLLTSTRPPPREAAELVATVADALHYAHEMGVIHRDVKPANIMLDEKGAPRLMDFGLARRDAGDATMTIDGQVLGTPAYMSPEQARGESRNVDGRSDVYSLGVILYQLLTGALPFRGDPRLLLHQVLHEEPERVRSVNHLAPRDLETICHRAMSKEPSARYATARDMADDLRRFLRDEPIMARPIRATERVWRWCRRKPALAGLIVVVFALLAAIAVGGTAVVSILLVAMATGAIIAALQFRRRAQNEKLLRSEADENLYYHRIALAHQHLTSRLPHPGRAEALLDACPEDRRQWEWSYLKRLWRVDPVALTHPDSKEFRSVTFSHDGRQLAAACGDGKIRVWDQKTGEVVVLSGHAAFVYSVAFSPVDSNRLASSGNDGLVRVWDLKSRRETLSPLPGVKVYADGMAYCVTFSPDGEWIAASSEGGTVQVWDAETGDLEYSLEGHSVWASCVAFSRDGRLLATGDWAGNVRLWDASSGQFLYQLQLPERQNPVGGLAFSPDPAGQNLAACYFGRQVEVWDTASRQIYQRLPGHTGFLTGLAFHPQDARRLVTAGEDRTVRLWDVPSGREVLQLQGHTGNCSGLAFKPDGRILASASYDRSIRLWDATNIAGIRREELQSLQFDHEAWSVVISPDGRRIAAAGLSPNLRIWDTATGHESGSFTTLFTGLLTLAFGPDGRRVAAAGFDGGVPACVVKVLDLDTGQTQTEYREGQEIFAVAFSPPPADGWRWDCATVRSSLLMLRPAKRSPSWANTNAALQSGAYGFGTTGCASRRQVWTER